MMHDHIKTARVLLTSSYSGSARVDVDLAPWGPDSDEHYHLDIVVRRSKDGTPDIVGLVGTIDTIVDILEDAYLTALTFRDNIRTAILNEADIKDDEYERRMLTQDRVEGTDATELPLHLEP